MTLQPLASVVLPAYNAAPYLAECIESILSQTYQNWELLLINDGSVDETERIALSYADDRIKYLKNDQNQGLIFSLNRGLDLANGEFVVRMDADDVCFPDRLSKQIEYLLRESSVAAVGGALSIIGGHETVSYETSTSIVSSVLLFESPAAHPALVIRKSALGGLRYKAAYECAEDYKFLADLHAAGGVSNLPDTVLGYRKHDEQVSARNLLKQKRTHTKIVAELIARDFNVKIREDIFFRYFSFQSLTTFDLVYLLFVYGTVWLKSFGLINYNSPYIFKRLKTFVGPLLRSVR